MNTKQRYREDEEYRKACIESAKKRYRKNLESPIFRRLKLTRSRYRNCNKSIKYHLEKLTEFKNRRDRIEPVLTRLEEQWKWELEQSGRKTRISKRSHKYKTDQIITNTTQGTTERSTPI